MTMVSALSVLLGSVVCVAAEQVDLDRERESVSEAGGRVSRIQQQVIDMVDDATMLGRDPGEIVECTFPSGGYDTCADLKPDPCAGLDAEFVVDWELAKKPRCNALAGEDHMFDECIDDVEDAPTNISAACKGQKYICILCDGSEVREIHMKRMEIESLNDLNFAGLEVLNLNSNHLKTLPDLPNTLTDLSIRDNHFITLPYSVTSHRGLEKLHLESNLLVELHELPRSLKLLNLDMNPVRLLHKNNMRGLNGLNSLQVLSMREMGIDNRARDALPSILLELPSLVKLDLSKNRIRSLAFEDEDGQFVRWKDDPDRYFRSLINLDLRNNKMEDLDGIDTIESLESLALSDNGLLRIDKEMMNMDLGKMTNLRNLRLAENRITEIPDDGDWHMLTQLESLSLRSNNLMSSDGSSPLPEALADLASLTDLELHGNRNLQMDDIPIGLLQAMAAAEDDAAPGVQTLLNLENTALPGDLAKKWGTEKDDDDQGTIRDLLDEWGTGGGGSSRSSSRDETKRALI